MTDHTAPQENDASGNLNNVLTTDRIVKHTPASAGIMSGVTPTSTTAALAKDVPLEKSTTEETSSSALPGSFPETPAAVEKGEFSVAPLPATEGSSNPITLAPGESVPDSSTLTSNTIASGVHDDPELVEILKKQEAAKAGEETFSVSPLPAFPGAVNPIKIAPGETLPDPSTLTGNTIHSNVRTDPESYEKSGGIGDAPVLPPVVTPQGEREQKGTGILDLPPISKNLIPESSLPIGTSGSEGVDAGPTIQSSGPESTTANLAGAVPLESSKVPEIVKESQKEAGVDPEASAIAEEVKEKSAVEKELESKVPVVPSTSEGVAGEGTTKTESSVTAGEAAAAVGGAFVALGGAAVLATSSLVSQLPASVTSKLPTEVQESINNTNTEANKMLAATQDTPEIVKDSIIESGQAPEAAANEEAVLEKKEVEKELLAEVKKVSSTGEAAPKITSDPSTNKLEPPVIAKEPESRDVSPGTIPGSRVQTHTEPTVTTGVSSSTTAEKSGAGVEKDVEKPAEVNKPAEVSTPVKSTAGNSKTTESPASASASQKKKNRASAFFSKIKSKLSDHK